MPCENCNAQFTVFKRKKSCLECRRLYCSNCLVKQQKEIVLCHKCVVFKRRPLTKIELLKLKSKDLIFYLQSKHISTTGCVEKEELVNLVLSHIHSTNYAENMRSPNSSYSSSSSRSNQNDLPHAFDTIKQTCQNLFTSFTDKITTDLNFDSGKTNNNNQNIFCQPRGVSRPTENVYNNQSNNDSLEQDQGQQQTHSQPQDHSRHYNEPRENYNSSSQISSPRSNDTTSPLTVNGVNSIFSNQSYNENNTDNNHSKNNIRLQAEININENRPGTSSGQNHNNQKVNHNINVSKKNVQRRRLNESDSSTTSSSFEELGAIGGAHSDIENWHFVQTNNVNSSPNIAINGKIKKNKLKILNRNLHMNGVSTNSAIDLNNTQSGLEIKNDQHPQRQQRLTRRRSDTFIIMNPNILLDPERSNLLNLDIDLIESSRKRSRKCCLECGIGLKKHLSKFRHQLESSNLTEIEKKNRIEDFLHSLENKCTQGQFQHNDLGSPLTSNDNNDINTNAINTDEHDTESLDRFTNENDGINVYPTISFMYDEQGGDEAEVIAKSKIRGRLKLNDISSRSDLEELSVKQLKEILMLNRVDFKGCCEKTELLERVYRLWKDHMATPAVEKLTTEDLCKICMDAPIECVILECGHMVTCTSCGKVLNECPICRQYIVRVVRFFRA